MSFRKDKHGHEKKGSKDHADASEPRKPESPGQKERATVTDSGTPPKGGSLMRSASVTFQNAVTSPFRKSSSVSSIGDIIILGEITKETKEIILKSTVDRILFSPVRETGTGNIVQIVCHLRLVPEGSEKNDVHKRKYIYMKLNGPQVNFSYDCTASCTETPEGFCTIIFDLKAEVETNLKFTWIYKKLVQEGKYNDRRLDFSKREVIKEVLSLLKEISIENETFLRKSLDAPRTQDGY